MKPKQVRMLWRSIQPSNNHLWINILVSDYTLDNLRIPTSDYIICPLVITPAPPGRHPIHARLLQIPLKGRCSTCRAMFKVATAGST